MANDIFAKILAHKTKEIRERAQSIDLSLLKEKIQTVEPVRGFIKAIEKDISVGKTAIIAEIKKASPSQGVIREKFDPAEIALSYASYGASCLSVLTDQAFFQGHDDYLDQARQASGLPVLRKDFIIDPYQLYEARAIGADAVLLIVAALDNSALQQLVQLAGELNLDLLIEVHDRTELQRALRLPCRLIGVNNRNLRTFKTHLKTTLDLLTDIPDNRIVVTESGIHSNADVKLMRTNQVHAFLVGEALMRAEVPGQKMADLFQDR